MPSKFLQYLSQAVATFGRREKGSTSVEAALWLPFFILFTFGVGQLGLILYGQSRILGIADQATRALSVGEFASDTDAENWIRAQLAQVSGNVRADAFFDANGAMVRTIIRVPASDLGGFGFFTSLMGFDITVHAQRPLEFANPNAASWTHAQLIRSPGDVRIFAAQTFQVLEYTV